MYCVGKGNYENKILRTSHKDDTVPWKKLHHILFTSIIRVYCYSAAIVHHQEGYYLRIPKINCCIFVYTAFCCYYSRLLHYSDDESYIFSSYNMHFNLIFYTVVKWDISLCHEIRVGKYAEYAFFTTVPQRCTMCHSEIRQYLIGNNTLHFLKFT